MRKYDEYGEQERKKLARGRKLAMMRARKVRAGMPNGGPYRPHESNPLPGRACSAWDNVDWTDYDALEGED